MAELDQAALEEYKLCLAKQEASQGRIWPMASVLLIFSLGGLALLGRQSVSRWEDLAVIGASALISVALIWLWRISDWRETYWDDLLDERMCELEQRLGFLMNLGNSLLLLPEADRATSHYWEALQEPERAFIKDFQRRHAKPPPRMRQVFTWIAWVGTGAWATLFAVRLIELIQR